jgi:hypothetical protein
VANCRCDPGYTGNAFISCQRVTTRKYFLKSPTVLRKFLVSVV